MDNIDIVYSDFVKKLLKPGQKIIDSLTPEKANALHMAVGVAGEAGELLDAVKKHVIYDKEPDIENIIEEVGDIEFFLEGVRAQYGITREQCLTANRAKLAKRYNELTYSDKAAHERADKLPEGADKLRTF